MATAVIPHTFRQPREIKLHQLPAPVADQLNHLLDTADQHAGNHDLAAYVLLHAQAINLIGIRPPARGELARCTCQACYCDTVFDEQHARYYLDGTVEFIQCPGCVDDHLIHVDD
jgi:NAD-dependent SIR2 family protein deacetylase